MHRYNLIDQISFYKTSKWCYSEDLAIADEFISFITQNEKCFLRELAMGHLTASCWLWNEDQTACLFTFHRKLKKWLQLGGHADGHPNLLEVSIKEAQEESGIPYIKAISPHIFDLSIHEIPASPFEKRHKHYDVRYLLKVTRSAPLVISQESIDLKWIQLEDFKNYDLDPSILKMGKKINL